MAYLPLKGHLFLSLFYFSAPCTKSYRHYLVIQQACVAYFVESGMEDAFLLNS